jgi:hypothetical protein
MSLLDRAKAAAAKVAAEAQKGASQVQDKVEKTQTRRKADDLAKQLGYLIVRERTGSPASEEADSLVSQIAALDAELAAEPEESPTADGEARSEPTPSAPSASASDPITGASALD